MRKNAWYVILGAAVLLGAVGCGDDDGDIIVPGDAGPGGDAGTGDAGGPEVDGGPVTCGSVGRVGGACRVGACLDDLECIEEFRISGAQLTVRNALGIGQAQPEDPANPETFVAVTTPNPADDVAITFANGSICTEQCDTAAATDMCGSCGRCSAQMGNDAIGLPVTIFIDAASQAYGDDTGLCRSICDFEIDGRGGCPEGYTCDAFTNICLESCRNDAQCNATLVITEDGEYATWIVPDGGRTCNTTTGRCDWTQSETSTVGNECNGQADCTEDVGVCLRGGTCAETQCNRATDTDETTFVCDGGRGICLGAGGNNGAVCVQGCTTSDDCNPGNACIPLGGGTTAGSFTGYCLGICDTVDSSSMTGSADELFSCGTHDGVVEQCDMPAATAEDPDPDGTCRPTCNPADADSCEDDEVCEAVEGTSYGFCRLLSSFCFEQGDCAGGQVCDNAIGSSTFGRCVDACTPAVPADVCAGIAAADRCTATDTASCTDADTLRTCAPNAQGCLVWTDTTCTDGCDDSGAEPVCTAATACADPAPCTEGRTCDGSDLVICAPDASGCLAETRETCTDGCDDSGAVAACTVEGTPASCATATDVCVESGALAGLCATPCTAATAGTVCGAGRMCQVPAGSPSGFCVEM